MSHHLQAGKLWPWIKGPRVELFPFLLFSEDRGGTQCLGHIHSINQRCLQSTNQDHLPLYAVVSCTQGCWEAPVRKTGPEKSAPSKLQPLVGLGTQAFWMVGSPDERPTCNAAPTPYPPCPFSLPDYEALTRPSSTGQGQGTFSSWKPAPSHPTPTPPFTTPARSPTSDRSGPFSNCSALSRPPLSLYNCLSSIDSAAPAWEDREHHVSINTWVYLMDDSEGCAGGILEGVYRRFIRLSRKTVLLGDLFFLMVLGVRGGDRSIASQIQGSLLETHRLTCVA